MCAHSFNDMHKLVQLVAKHLENQFQKKSSILKSEIEKSYNFKFINTNKACKLMWRYISNINLESFTLHLMTIHNITVFMSTVLADKHLIMIHGFNYIDKAV